MGKTITSGPLPFGNSAAMNNLVCVFISHGIHSPYAASGPEGVGVYNCDSQCQVAQQRG